MAGWLPASPVLDSFENTSRKLELMENLMFKIAPNRFKDNSTDRLVPNL